MLSGLRILGRSTCKLVTHQFPSILTNPSGQISMAGRVLQTNSFITLRSPLVSSGCASGVLAVRSPACAPMCVRQMSSLMKKRRTKMNKHKLKKRRKALKMNTKQSRK